MNKEAKDFVDFIKFDSDEEPVLVPADEVSNREYDVIAQMLKLARGYMLEVEVVHSFAKELISGSQIEEAAAAALYEWDI